MYYTEQQKKKQEILQRLKNQQQLAEQRARQEKFGLDDILTTGGQINTLSKNASYIGKGLAKSNNAFISNVGNKLKTVGDFGQKFTGEGVKQQIGNALKSKLGLGAKAATQAGTTATTTGATTGATAAGTAAGVTGATTTGATGALGATGAGTTAGTAAGTLGTLASTGTSGAGAAGAVGAAGAGAATTGAGVGSAALGVLGPVGAALAAGYMIYNMINSAKKKKAAKQMQVSAQAAQDNMQQAAAKKAEAMQSLQPQVAQPQQSYIPEAGTQEEVVEPQVEQPVEEETSPLDMLTEGLTPDGETSDLGGITGGAVPVDLEATKTSLMDKLRTGVGNISNASQSGLDRLASGLNDFAAGYKDNATTSITEGDLYKRLMPSSTEQTGETQTEDGAYVLSADEKKKNLMNRLGEAVGTGRRIIAHPLTQGVVAGLAYGKSEDDPLYGLGKGVEWTQGKAKSDYYQRKIDPNSIPSIMGGYSEKDYNADTLSKYRETTAENNRTKAKLAQRKQDFDENMNNKKFAETQRLNNAKIKHMENSDNIKNTDFQNKQADIEKKRKEEIYAGLQDGSYVEMENAEGIVKAVPIYDVKEAEALGFVRKKKAGLTND